MSVTPANPAELLLRAQSMLRTHGVSDSHALMVEIDRAVTGIIDRVLPLGTKGGRLRFEVIGVPKGQGNLIPNKQGKLIHRSDKALQTWRRLVTNAAREAYGGRDPLKRREPVAVGLMFRMPIPPRGKPGSKIAKPGAWCTTVPDLDKLSRAVLDALTGAVITDDCQVTAWLPNNGMRWVGKQELPGATIEIAGLEPR